MAKSVSMGLTIQPKVPSTTGRQDEKKESSINALHYNCTHIHTQREKWGK